MRIKLDPEQRAEVLEMIYELRKQEIEANEELFNLFRRDVMDSAAGAPTTEAPPKVFELLVKQLTSASSLAEQLSGKSEGLVSLFIDKPPQKIEEKTTEKAVQSPVLAHALTEIVSNLNKSLLEISNNLEKLENAW